MARIIAPVVICRVMVFLSRIDFSSGSRRCRFFTVSEFFQSVKLDCVPGQLDRGGHDGVEGGFRQELHAHLPLDMGRKAPLSDLLRIQEGAFGICAGIGVLSGAGGVQTFKCLYKGFFAALIINAQAARIPEDSDVRSLGKGQNGQAELSGFFQADLSGCEPDPDPARGSVLY